MQLLSIYIDKYKNLIDFHWEIGAENASSALLLMGKNASGKTNILEAIIKIFDFLMHSKQQKSPFTFFIEYKIENSKIKIECDKGYSIDEVSINDVIVPLSEINRIENTFRPRNRTDLKNLLPDNIILYYSGFAGRFNNISHKFKQEYARVFRNQKYVGLPPLILLEPIHNKMIMLALFSFEENSLVYDGFLKKYFNIEGLNSFEIHIKEHTGWIEDHSYNNFFDTRGIVRNFLEKIHKIQLETGADEYSFRKLSPKDSSRVKRVDYKFKGNETLLQLKEIFGYEDDIFKLLNILYTTKNLANIIIKVQKSGIKTPIDFNLLSEGEQQFLAIRGMIYLLQGKNSLFLWDEPDTYLNPSWQWDLIPSLEKDDNDVHFIQRDQFILTTHSPVLLTTVKKQAYYVENGVLSCINHSYGLTIDESLEKQNINIRVEELDTQLKQYFRLIEIGNANSEEARKMRATLEKELGETHRELQRADVLINFYE